MYARSGAELWVSSWWFLVHCSSSVAVAWTGSLAFCAQVLGIRYS